MGMPKNTVRRWISDERWSVMGPALEAAKHSKAGKPSQQGDRDFLETPIWAGLQQEALDEALPKENLIATAALDKGYDANAIRARPALEGIEPVIPGRSNRIEPIPYDEEQYKERNRVERFFNKLKQFRRIATRDEKHAFTFLAMIHIVAAFISAWN